MIRTGSDADVLQQRERVNVSVVREAKVECMDVVSYYYQKEAERTGAMRFER
jgi:hypothetical protein